MYLMLGRTPSRNRQSYGFTLLEVLLAVLLVTLGFLALSQAFSLGLFASGNNDSLVVAGHLAQEKIEEIRNKTYSNVSNETRATVTGFPAFEREVVVSTPQTNLKQVSVNVYWFNKDDELSTRFVSYVSNI